jgi:hypothetical protein
MAIYIIKIINLKFKKFGYNVYIHIYNFLTFKKFIISSSKFHSESINTNNRKSRSATPVLSNAYKIKIKP